jgi:hypothetical protein
MYSNKRAIIDTSRWIAARIHPTHENTAMPLDAQPPKLRRLRVKPAMTVVLFTHPTTIELGLPAHLSSLPSPVRLRGHQ